MADLQFILVMALAALCRVGESSSGLTIPKECKDKDFCDVKPKFYDNYQKEINEKFEPIKKFMDLKEDTDKYYEDVIDNFETNCKSVTKTFSPFLVKVNGTTRIIVQTDIYKQNFSTTECLQTGLSSTKGEQCFKGLLTGTSEGYCKTKYTSIALYVYNNEKSKIERVPVELPVCCYCSITS